MSETEQYILDPEALVAGIRKGKKHRFLKGVGVVLAGAALFVLYLWFYVSVLGLDLPKTVILKHRNAEWAARAARVDDRLEACGKALDALEQRDETIYRSVYGMDPILPEVRNAGFSGTERYDWMDGLSKDSPLRSVTLRLDHLMKKAYVQSRSYDEVASLSRIAGDMASHIPAICPLDPAPGSFHLSSPFGYRSDPISGEAKLHAGMDFACPPGNPIHAAGDGIVETVSNEFFGYGNCVVIDHGFGYKSRYAHMDEIEVEEGMRITRGTRLGTTGRSGRVTGPHLHYEVLYKGEPVNPAHFMDLDIAPEDYRQMVAQAGGAR